MAEAHTGPADRSATDTLAACAAPVVTVLASTDGSLHREDGIATDVSTTRRSLSVLPWPDRGAGVENAAESSSRPRRAGVDRNGVPAPRIRPGSDIAEFQLVLLTPGRIVSEKLDLAHRYSAGSYDFPKPTIAASRRSRSGSARDRRMLHLIVADERAPRCASRYQLGVFPVSGGPSGHAQDR